MFQCEVLFLQASKMISSMLSQNSNMFVHFFIPVKIQTVEAYALD